MFSYNSLQICFFILAHCAIGCQNGGTCVKHDICQCLSGFTGRHCEIDIDECKEQKPCDQICYNTPGSYNCQCKEDFLLQKDGQTCRKEGMITFLTFDIVILTYNLTFDASTINICTKTLS